MKIVLPWPNPKVFPNAKRGKHWSFYRKAEKSDREAGNYLTMSQLSLGIRDVRAMLGSMAYVPLCISFYPPDRRKRDDDGMIGALKHLRDGMCDALNIDDAKLRPTYVFHSAEKPGRIEVTL